tara:strand:+ start:10909 stop:12273 length:1365 start_codon:yes stop_codon:yes gene_type:complete
MSIPPPFSHQSKTTDFILNNERVLITSDPGTGKTRSVIDAFVQQTKEKPGRLLVLAPLSILQPSWGDDIEKFAPDLTYSVALSKNRTKEFLKNTDICITNHDAVKWITKNMHVLEGFTHLCIDEFTAFKNKDSQRSKAMLKVAKHFDNRIAMSGTPNSNGILDIWHPTLIVDDGQRLGHRFYSFRQNVCTAHFNGFGQEWVEKDSAREIVAAAIKDINIRFELESCLDMPEQTTTERTVELPPAVLKAYRDFAEDSVLYTKQGTVNAVHAGARTKKLLQMCTGAVYDEDGEVVKVHDQRYDLVMSLVEEREHSLVAFNWTHERDCLTAKANKLGISYGVIDGATPVKKRKEIVDRMQAGQLQVVFAHPQSAGHGLTLTRATTVIWASPTYNAEYYQQFNRRIYRAGQKKRTEIIHIQALNTGEPGVYEKLEGKLTKMEDLLTTLTKLNSLRRAA